MLFPTVDFAIFFCLVFLGHWLLNPRPMPWKLFMIAASYVFYAWWDVHFVWLLAGVSAIAQIAAIVVARQEDERRRRWAMGIGVAATLAPLAYFKYYGFFSLNLTRAMDSAGIHAGLPLVNLILPVGLSFFSFMAVSYVVDVYRRQFEVASWVDVFLYLSFFPHLVAGPIVRPDELIPQLDVRRDPRHLDVAGAGYLIFGGLFKKVVISSFLATTIVDPVFADPSRVSAFEAIVGVWAYAIVIYSDFSGYTDIAIGVAKLLGFQFPVNFDRPYSARSLQDFWRRWHITLSRWLRDYLYIPLGGSKKGERRTYVNIMITMVLGGLWHGAAWPMIIWGAYHGAGQCIGAWRRGRAKAAGLEPVETPGRIWLQRVDHLQPRLRGLGVLPGRHGRDRPRAPQADDHRMGHRGHRARFPPGVGHDRPHAGTAVRAAPPRRGAAGPDLGAQAVGDGRRVRHRAVRDRHARPPGRGALHLLPVLTMIEVPR